MLQTITPAEMKRVEQRTMQQTHVSGLTLMERASAGIAAAVLRLCAGRSGTVLCLCGPGNNGGDGLAAMRLFIGQSPSFQGECWLLPGKRTAELEHQLTRLTQEQPAVRVVSPEHNHPLPPVREIACIIDGLFGTGLTRPLTGLALELCRFCNQLHSQGIPVVSVDIPSGLDGSTGAVLGEAVYASETVTFHRPKPGMYLGQGLDRSGRITLWDIGIPPAMDDAAGYHLLEPEDLAAFLPPRKHLSHKGTYGRVLLWAGQRGMAGAAALCATAALRAGAGLVTIACWDELVDTVQLLCPCATCIPLPRQEPDKAFELLQNACEKADALGIGCGLGQDAPADSLLKRLLAYLSRRTDPLPLVLDADGLNLLSAFTDREREAARPALRHAVLTPHPAEAARLLGCATAHVTEDTPTAAIRLCRRYGAAVLLKGAVDVLATNEGIALNVLGTPSLAKGGSGDVLAGVMTALSAGQHTGVYNLTTLQCMQTAAALHGLAGLQAEQRYGQRGVLATDLCACLGLSFAGEKVPFVSPLNIADDSLCPSASCLFRKKAVSADGLAKAAATKASVAESTAEPAATSSFPKAHVQAQSQTNEAVLPDRLSPLGRRVTITIDHKLGTKLSPEGEQLYLLNCGYVQEELAAHNRWQDACVYGVHQPLEFFEGLVVAVLNSPDSHEARWIVAPDGMSPAREQLLQAVAFWVQDGSWQLSCL